MLRPTEIPPLGVAVVGLGWWGRTIASLLKGHRKFRLEMGVDVQPVQIEGLRVEKSFEAALETLVANMQQQEGAAAAMAAARSSAMTTSSPPRSSTNASSSTASSRA